MGHPEVTIGHFFGIPPFLMTNEDNRSPIELRDASHNGRIISIISITVKFNEMFKQMLNIMGRLRPVDMPSQLCDLPTGQVGKYFLLQTTEFLF
jgi:hypothetical protein